MNEYDQIFSELFGSSGKEGAAPKWDGSRRSEVVKSLRFHHKTFGDGTVMAVDYSNRWKMVIAFDEVGEKTIFASHLEPIEVAPDRENLIRRRINSVAGANQSMREMLCEKYGIETYRPSAQDLPEVYQNEDGTVSVHESKESEVRFSQQRQRVENVTSGLTVRDNLPSFHELKRRQAASDKAKEQYEAWKDAGSPGRKGASGPNRVCCGNCQWQATWNDESIARLRNQPSLFVCPQCKAGGSLYASSSPPRSLSTEELPQDIERLFR